MKLDEFKRQVEKLGLFVGKLDHSYVIEKEKGEFFYGMIDNDMPYRQSTIYRGFYELSKDKQAKLQKLMYKFSRTPIDERKPEKKWYVKVPNEWNMSAFFEKYDGLTMRDWLSKDNTRSQFTMQEIKDYKLESFERVEVEK